MLLLPVAALLVAGGVFGVFAWHRSAPGPEDAEKVVVSLSRGDFTCRWFPATDDSPRALVVFGSGDGGWSSWENRFVATLRSRGLAVMGIDMEQYAASDYQAEILARDFATIAREGLARCPDGTPVIYAGWSMGAGQAVAAAASGSRPQELAGLLLVSTVSRGRYGLRMLDRVGIPPEGRGTFGLAGLAPKLDGLSIALFQPGADPMTTDRWLGAFGGRKVVYRVPGANHGFGGLVDESLLGLVGNAVNWLLDDDIALPGTLAATLPGGLSEWWPAALALLAVSVLVVMFPKLALRLIVGSVVWMGLINLAESVFAKPPAVLAWMDDWMPLGVTEHSRTGLFLTGLLLLLLARGLHRRKKAALRLTLILLIVSMILHLTRAFDWHHSVAAGVLVLAMLRWRREFRARSDAPSLRRAVLAGILLLLVLSLFGAHGVGHAGGGLGFMESWGHAWRGICQLQTPADGMPQHARAVVDAVGTSSLVVGFVVVSFMLRPVLARRRTLPEDVERAGMIVARHGSDPMSGFALLPDKRYAFFENGSVVVAYALWRNIAVVLADPIGPTGLRAAAIRHFVQFCRAQDWDPVFYNVHVSNLGDYGDAGLATLKIGEDARIPLGEFTLKGSRFQDLRSARNKAAKLGWSFRWYDGSSPVDFGLEAQMKMVSDEWLRRHGLSEMTFDLGSFDMNWIRRHGAGVAMDADGRLLGFTTWMSYDSGRGQVLDLMRARDGAAGVMDFILTECLVRFQQEGVGEASLGNAPLADTGRHAGQSGGIVGFLYENFDRYYGYKSLFAFKSKFHPQWQGRFLAYWPRTNPAAIGFALVRVHLPQGLWKLIKS